MNCAEREDPRVELTFDEANEPGTGSSVISAPECTASESPQNARLRVLPNPSRSHARPMGAVFYLARVAGSTSAATC